jgi:hypothetical protein
MEKSVLDQSVRKKADSDGAGSFSHLPAAARQKLPGHRTAERIH